MKKNKIRFDKKSRKRTTFGALFAKSACIAVAVSLIFGYYLYELGRKQLYSDLSTQLTELTQRITTKINNEQEQYGEVNDMDSYLSVYTTYQVYPESFFYSFYDYWIIPRYTENCYAISAILDENGEIICSSTEKWASIMNIGEESENKAGWYAFDPDEITGVDIIRFEEDYKALAGKSTDFCDIEMKIKSAYVDSEHFRMIPHEAELHLLTSENSEDVLLELTETKEVNITVDEPNYVLVEDFGTLTGSELPKASVSFIHCTDKKTFDELSQGFKVLEHNEPSKTESSWFGKTGYKKLTEQKVYMNGKECTLCVLFQIDLKNTSVETLYYEVVAVFTLITLLVALLWSWRKNTINQTRYAFEDYQRTLTNNLAHDLKTPLTAISGYAENILDMYDIDSTHRNYLNSILENVAYTDSIINKTLELNKIDQLKKLEKSTVDLNAITDSLLEKYKSDMEEKAVSCTVNGKAKVKSNPETLSIALENLISNAVKYTSECGKVDIEINQRYFKIKNTVAEKVDTTNLTMPFVRGDEARSDKLGNGLGLSIAENSLMVNGFKLEISCSNTEFTALIKF